MEQIGENKYRVRKSKAVLCGVGFSYLALTGESNLTYGGLNDPTFPLAVPGGREPVGPEMCLWIPDVRCPGGLSIMPFLVPAEKQCSI